MYELVGREVWWCGACVRQLPEKGDWRLTHASVCNVAAVTDDTGKDAVVFVDGDVTAQLERHDYYTFGDGVYGAHKTFLLFSPAGDQLVFETRFGELDILDLHGNLLWTREIDFNPEFIGPWWLVASGTYVVIAGWMWQPFQSLDVYHLDTLFDTDGP